MNQLACLVLAISAASFAQAQDTDTTATQDTEAQAPVDDAKPVAEQGSGHRAMLPFMRELAGDHELPRPYGIGMDIFTMRQGYEIESLTFALPGFSLPDPSVIDVQNDLVHNDLKFDAWVFPFLNVFGIYGHVSAHTDVDLSAVAVPGLPVSLGTLQVRYDGSVYGGGATLAVGGDHWFASLTGTWTQTSLSGDFDSNVKARTMQPKLGFVAGPWSAWVGAMDLHTDESHVGVIVLPGLGAVPFAVELKNSAGWTPSVGVRYAIDRFGEVTFEYGGGDRRTTLLNVALRFPRDD